MKNKSKFLLSFLNIFCAKSLLKNHLKFILSTCTALLKERSLKCKVVLPKDLYDCQNKNCIFAK